MKNLCLFLILSVFNFNTAWANRPQCQNLFTLSKQQIAEKTTRIELNPKKIRNLTPESNFRVFVNKSNVSEYFKNVVKFVKQISNNEIVSLVTHFIQRDQGFIDQPVTRFEDYRVIHLKMIMIDYIQNKHLNKEKDTNLWTEQYLKFFIPSHILLEANHQVLLTGNFEFRVLGTALIIELFSRRSLTHNEELTKLLLSLNTRAASRQQTSLSYANNQTQVNTVQIVQIPENLKQNLRSTNNPNQSTNQNKSLSQNKAKNQDTKKSPEEYQLIINNYLNKSINDPFLYQELLSIQLNQRYSIRERTQLISRKFDYSERIKKHEESEHRLRLSRMKTSNPSEQQQSLSPEYDLNDNHQNQLTALGEPSSLRPSNANTTNINIDSSLKKVFNDFPELTYSVKFWELFDQLNDKSSSMLYTIAKELRIQNSNQAEQNNPLKDPDQLITFTKSAEKEAAHISDHTLKKHLSEFLEIMKSLDWREYFEHDKRWDYHQHSHSHPIYGDGVRTVDAGRKGTRIIFRIQNSNEVVILGINADKIHLN